VQLRRDLPSLTTARQASRRGKQVTIRLRLTSGVTRHRRRLWRGKQVTVAPGIERGDVRAFRNADRFTTFKIFRRPGAL
jgi:hypothetical protein